MNIFRKTLLLTALLCLGIFQALTAGELEKWVPADGMFYGKISGKNIRGSALFNRLLQKYPEVQELMKSGRELAGGYQGDLDTVVVSVVPGVGSVVCLMEFSESYDPGTVAAALDAQQNMAGLYQKITVAGKSGYMLKHEAPQGQYCFFMVSDRVMLCCLRSAAETILAGPKLSGDLAKKLETSIVGDIFFRAFNGGETALINAGIRDIDAVGRLSADAALHLQVRLTCTDEPSAKGLEMQIRQGLMFSLGLLFADDSQLGMEILGGINVTRNMNEIVIKSTMTAGQVERLVVYCGKQVEKRKAAQAKKEAAQKTLPQGNSEVR